MKAGEEVAGGFFVACRDAAKLLDILKETLDQVAFGIEGVVALAFGFAIGLGRNDRFDLSAFEAGDETVGVVAFVSEDRIWFHLGDKPFGLGDVVNLSAGEAQRQRIAQGVDDDMNFGSQPAARATYGLVETPFFRAPALCWWALTMVASIMAYSLSGSSAKVLKRLSHTPVFAQRENRV